MLIPIHDISKSSALEHLHSVTVRSQQVSQFPHSPDTFLRRSKIPEDGALCDFRIPRHRQVLFKPIYQDSELLFFIYTQIISIEYLIGRAEQALRLVGFLVNLCHDKSHEHLSPRLHISCPLTAQSTLIPTSGLPKTWRARANRVHSCRRRQAFWSRGLWTPGLSSARFAIRCRRATCRRR